MDPRRSLGRICKGIWSVLEVVAALWGALNLRARLLNSNPNRGHTLEK